MNYVLLTAASELRRYVNALQSELNSTDPASTGLILFRTAQIEGVVRYLEKEIKDE